MPFLLFLLLFLAMKAENTHIYQGASLKAALQLVEFKYKQAVFDFGI